MTTSTTPNPEAKEAPKKRRKRHTPSAEDIAAFNAKYSGGKKESKLRKAIREFGVPFMIYWTGAWACSGVAIFATLQFSGLNVDASALLASIGYEGDMSREVGNVMLAVALNEAAEVVRLPLCLLTFKRAKQAYTAWSLKRKH